MPKFLLVKTSSLGDVVHNLPVVRDLRAHFPDADIDWVVEAPFAAIPAMHPAIRRVHPVAVRRWRHAPFSGQTGEEVRAALTRLRETDYDFILDTQGLLKSALITRLAHGVRTGFDRASAREPLAAFFYQQTFRVEKNLHAVQRNRLLAAQAFGYPLDTAPDYGIAPPGLPLGWLPATPFVVFLHATSRASKFWPEERWVALAHFFAGQGIRCVLPWGNAEERLRSERLAGQMPQALVPSALSLPETATLFARARAVIGVDTGLAHLAAALNVPTLALYCATDPARTGVYAGANARNLGGIGAPPETAEVISVLREMGLP